MLRIIEFGGAEPFLLYGTNSNRTTLQYENTDYLL